MADRRKKSGPRSSKKDLASLQPSIIRFNVAEETTDIKAKSSSPQSPPKPKRPPAPPKAIRETAQTTTQSPPKQPLFRENDEDLTLFTPTVGSSNSDPGKRLAVPTKAFQSDSSAPVSPDTETPPSAFPTDFNHPLNPLDDHFVDEEETGPPSQVSSEPEGVFLIEDHYERPKEIKVIPPKIPPRPNIIKMRRNETPKSAKISPIESSVDGVATPPPIIREPRPSAASTSMLLQCHVVFSFLVFLFHVSSPSAYLTGLFDGAILACLITAAFLLYSLRQEESEEPDTAPKSIPTPLITDSVVKLLTPKPVIEDQFTAIRFYDDPTVHQPSLTTKVRLRLDGHNLHVTSLERDTRMSFHRLADDSDAENADDDDETNDDEATVTDTKVIDLRQASVKLVPMDISRKQRFSKKFPIRITSRYSLPDVCQSLGLGHGPVTARTKRLKEASRTIYVFAPTSRKKELWFWRFVWACRASDDKSAHLATPLNFDDYVAYMAPMVRNFCSPVPKSAAPAAAAAAETLKTRGKRASPIPRSIASSSSIGWFNAFLGRAFWDAWNEPKLKEYLQRKWQHKMEKLKTPWFMRPLIITNLSLGDHLPTVRKIWPPRVNAEGIWVDLDLDYQNGTFCITMETSLNFMQTGESSETALVSISHNKSKDKVDAGKTPKPDGDSDIDSGAEDDEDRGAHIDETDVLADEKPSKASTDTTTTAAAAPSGETKSRLMRIANKVANSRIMKKVGQTKWGQKLSEKVANTRLVLTVRILSLRGRLTINMTPPPTDRIW